MSDFGSMNVADSLKASWVDANGKSIMTGKLLRDPAPDVEIVSFEQNIVDRICALEIRMEDLTTNVFVLSDKLRTLVHVLEKTPEPEKKPKKAKK